jgi:hypothetical protein
MKTNFLNLLFTASLIGGLWIAPPPAAQAQGFTDGFSDAYVTFYGEVRQLGGANTVLLQSGELEMTFVNQVNPANRVTLKTSLRPTGPGIVKPWSYALKVPLAFLPEIPRMGEFLSIGNQSTSFNITEVTIDGAPATLPDGSKEFYGLSFASRTMQYRLDLIVAGDSTDSDSDGMPDWWEKLHGLDPNLADAGGDPDEDGWNNLEEYQRGGDPNVSNRDPLLATAEILVPESGTAGIYLKFLDSDTDPAGITVTLPDGGASAAAGFEIQANGVPLAAGGAPVSFTLADILNGRLSITHIDRARSSVTLPLSWTDGGEDFSGQTVLRVLSPSTADGTDASLWLDGLDLAEDTPVASWPDRSGNGRHAMQPLAEYQPVASGGSVDFSSSPTAHLFFQNTALPAGNHTVLAAYQATASSDTAQVLLSTNRAQLKVSATTQAISYPGAPVYQIDDLAVGGYQRTSGTETTTSIFRRVDDRLENVFGLTYDGEASPAEVLDPVLPVLGARRSAIPSGGSPVDQPFSGQLHEMLVFPTALAEQKLREAHDYLQSKWSGVVIWDLGTELRDITIAAGADGTDNRRHIIRGGHGSDTLGGGPKDDIISGGPGPDILTGGGGADSFVFGGIDTGSDRITDFEAERDIIDLSALFWEQSGDARDFVSVRLDVNYSAPVPTLDSVLVVVRPDGGTQEIVLENTIIGAAELIQLVAEGRLRMGSLSIPTVVQIVADAGQGPLKKSLDEAFNVTVTRSGAGVDAAMDVPLGFFGGGGKGFFVVDGATDTEGQRTVVSFARGETSKTVTVSPVPDLEAGGQDDLQVAVLPHFRYSVAGSALERSIADDPKVWLEIIESNAIADPVQSARLRLHRDGDLSASLTVALLSRGTAKEGIHIEELANSITIPAGAAYADLEILPVAAGLIEGPKVVRVRLSAQVGYRLSHPHEALLYAASTAGEATGIGFDRWLSASSGGGIPNQANLARSAPRNLIDYYQAYALGLSSVSELGRQRMILRIANRRPELWAPGQFGAADLSWKVETSSDMLGWQDVDGAFEEVTDPVGLRLVGPRAAEDATSGFYRLSMNINPGPAVGDTLTTFTGSSRYAITGDAAWSTDPATGHLVTDGGSGRIIVQTTGPGTVAFEMAILDAGADDQFKFYIDGVEQAESTGAPVSVREVFDGPKSHLLMWQFVKGTGRAVIRTH